MKKYAIFFGIYMVFNLLQILYFLFFFPVLFEEYKCYRDLTILFVYFSKSLSIFKPKIKVQTQKLKG